MDLKELIRRTRGDRSYATLEADSGGSPGAQRWQQIATMQQRNFPDPATIRTMARVLGVPETTVVLAAARSAGLDIHQPGGPLAELLPPASHTLTERQLAAILAVIRAMLDPDGVDPVAAARAKAARKLAQQAKVETDDNVARDG